MSANMGRRPRRAFLKVCGSARAHAHEGAYHLALAWSRSHREGERTYIASTKRPTRDVQCAHLDKSG